MEQMKKLNTCKEFKIAVISDIHMGHGRLEPEMLYEHLWIYLYPLFEHIELLIINGDLFDTLLTMNSSAGLHAAKFIDDIINLAVKHQVYIRVVRGTFSHDRHQNQFFVVKDNGTHMLNNIPLVRVIDRITIEHVETLGINILYCPDNQPHKELTQAVIDVVNANGLQSVDLLCSHGYYEHLLPKGIPHIPTNTLSYDKLNKYVSGLMLNGHVHKASVYKDKVISLGSFERFEHDNERPVGMWVLTAKKDKHHYKWTYEFKENELSLRFKTYVIENYKSPEELMKCISDYVSSVVDDFGRMGYDWTGVPIYIRLVGNTTGIAEWIRSTYRNVYVTEQKTAVLQSAIYDELNTTSDELPIITEDNLAQMIYDNISDKKLLSYDKIKEILDEL